jgi:hypothetical protein
MKQTAMQIMLDELLSHGYKIPLHLVVKCKQLLEMEKQQKIMDYEMGYINGGNQKNITGEQYINETYGGNHAE